MEDDPDPSSTELHEERKGSPELEQPNASSSQGMATVLNVTSSSADSPSSQPAVPPDRSSAHNSPHSHNSTTRPPSPRVPLEQEFLLVDDNAVNLNILGAYMKKLGHQYMFAKNGLDALNAFRDFPGRFRAILMDISMPVMDGFEASRKIRALERTNRTAPIPIIALTGLASAGAQQEAFGSGINLFLTKPVRLKELTAILSKQGLR